MRTRKKKSPGIWRKPDDSGKNATEKLAQHIITVHDLFISVCFYTVFAGSEHSVLNTPRDTTGQEHTQSKRKHTIIGLIPGILASQYMAKT